MEKELLSYFLLSGLLDFFDIGSILPLESEFVKEEGFVLELIEKNILPDGYSTLDYESKGFLPSVKIQDFPMRGKLLFLSLRCRRWRHKVLKNQVIRRDFSFLTEKGVHMSKDLSAFLKGTGRDPRRYDVKHL